ncbi:MAG TPA: M28 family peptidase [Vicinamibacterales bacterium]
MTAGRALVGLLAVVGGWGMVHAQGVAPVKGVRFSQITAAELTEYLTYLSSDQLTGRQIYTEGYGLAAGYIQEHLRKWGVKPIGENGTYLQTVKSRGYKVTRNSTVTVEVGGQTRTFKQGEHVSFVMASGGKQTVTFSGVQFIGTNTAAVAGLDLKGKLAVWMNATPAAGTIRFARIPQNVGVNGAMNAGATGVVGFAPAPPPPTAATEALAKAQEALAQAQAAVTAAQAAARGNDGGFPGGRGGGRGVSTPIPSDLTTVQNVQLPVTPNFTGDEAFFEFLLSASPTKFADLKALAGRGGAMAPFAINAVVTVHVDNTFEVVSQQLAHNVVGMIEGSDPKLKDTYVMYGAHLDHNGYSQAGTGNPGGTSGCRNRSAVALAAVTAAGKTPVKNAPAGPPAGGATPPAAATRFDQGDYINNGADDDGSGSATLMAVARAFATGPRPKRSIVVVWHVGEEAGLLGSRYNADFPIVPLARVQAVLNMDMVGRDDCDDLEGDYTNSVFLVGDDRISTDLHNVIVETNQAMSKPLTLDYEMNDPADPEGVYTRSDHYSYASKGIPVAFFTTGLHPDYHRVSDSVEKIQFPKMARIGQLMYESGFAIAATERALERDNRGPRVGFGSRAEIIKK